MSQNTYPADDSYHIIGDRRCGADRGLLVSNCFHQVTQVPLVYKKNSLYKYQFQNSVDEMDEAWYSRLL